MWWNIKVERVVECTGVFPSAGQVLSPRSAGVRVRSQLIGGWGGADRGRSSCQTSPSVAKLLPCLGNIAVHLEPRPGLRIPCYNGGDALLFNSVTLRYVSFVSGGAGGMLGYLSAAIGTD